MESLAAACRKLADVRITDAQRQRFIDLYTASLDAAIDRGDLPADPGFRQAVLEHVEFGTEVAQQNSHAESDDELHPLREVPLWTIEAPGDSA